MDSSRRQNEIIRLTELYRKMNDGELEDIASEADELADYARELIAAELRRRNLPVPELEPPAHEELPTPKPEPLVEDDRLYEIDYQKLVMVRRYRDLPAAMLAKGALDSAEIECFLADDNMIRLDWFISNLLGGAKLLVKPEDLDAADELLDQPIPESFDAEGDESFERPKCPKCGSLDITYEDINKPLSYASAALLKFPYPFPRDVWKCNACAAEWQEVPDEPKESDNVDKEE